MNRRAKKGSQGDRRFTTGKTIAAIMSIVGVFEFDLDPCADELSRWGKAWFTEASNGLVAPWFGHVFVNPPWSDIGPWVVKAWAEMILGRPKSVTMLLPDNRQGTAWWQEHIEPNRDGGPRVCMPVSISLETTYLPGRPRYGNPTDPDGHKSKSPPFGSVVLHWSNVAARVAA